MPNLPPEILAIDWGATPAKRQLCRAVLRGRRYGLERPVAVDDPRSLELPPGALVAFDCPIGLPRSYAELASVRTFREGLSAFGSGRFERFYEPATTSAELSPERPFFPVTSKGAKREELGEALGEAAFALRDCDRATRAGPLFWLVGAKQVGRSAIAVWRDVLAPRLDTVALWPFDGPLEKLLASGRTVVAEMYPAFLLRLLGAECTSKRDPDARKACGAELLAKSWGVDLVAVRELLLDGFGPSPAGEDAFDATISALALAHLVSTGRIAEPPAETRAVEGWIVGL
jgi:hypothetical protein